MHDVFIGDQFNGVTLWERSSDEANDSFRLGIECSNRPAFLLDTGGFIATSCSLYLVARSGGVYKRTPGFEEERLADSGFLPAREDSRNKLWCILHAWNVLVKNTCHI